MTEQLLKGFRYAELARGEALQSPDTCEHCGRQELKKTIKLIHPSGRVVWYGVGCAANAMGIGIKVVRKARETQIENERQARIAADNAAWLAEEAKFTAWLTATVGAFADWDGRPNRAKQINALGGWKKASEAYEAHNANQVQDQ